MKSIVVTGASTGIGWGTTKILIGKGFRVFGSVRKPADAQRLSREFGASFAPLMFDVTDRAAVAAAAAKTGEALDGETLFGLVNNAGIAVPGPLLFLEPDEFRNQLEVNLTGQLIVTQAFAPLLMAKPGVPADASAKAGRIVMISSVGGKNANPFLGPYNASKFGLEGFSEALRRELMLFGIDVIIVAPGAVATPIWDKADTIDVTRYANTPYAPSLAMVKDYMVANGRKGLTPERLGEAVCKALTVAKPKTRYTVTPERFQNWMMNNLPKRMIDRMIAGRLGLNRKE